MKNNVNHITYNAVKEVVEIHFDDETVKNFPMTKDEWESIFSSGPEHAFMRIGELINE